MNQRDVMAIVESVAQVWAEREMKLLARIEESVARAVAAIPRPKDGEPGRSVTVEDVAPLIKERVASAVAAIPRPKDGEPGRSVTVEDVAPLIKEQVASAVAAIPRPKDGEKGEKGDPGEKGDKGDPGERGADGQGFELRGVWSSAESYARLAVVQLDNAVFAAIRDDPGPCPGDGWMQFSWRGKPGRPGQPGARGMDGLWPVAIRMDSTGLVILTLNDGTTVEGDFAPQLRQLH